MTHLLSRQVEECQRLQKETLQKSSVDVMHVEMGKSDFRTKSTGEWPAGHALSDTQASTLQNHYALAQVFPQTGTETVWSTDKAILHAQSASCSTTVWWITWLSGESSTGLLPFEIRP